MKRIILLLSVLTIALVCFLPVSAAEKAVFATIGIFSIVQITREVQMLIPAYDYCIPEKECITTTDSPCELFSRIEFPMNEFFPPRMDCEDQCHTAQS